MRTSKQYLLSSIGITVALGAVISSLAPSAHADPVDEFVNCSILNGITGCANVIDAKNWSESVTAWKFGPGQHNNMGDAFRHCTWIGALATRIGQADAYRVGFVHEESAKNQPSDEYLMDDWNNYVGAGIGANAVQSGTSDQWGYVLKECESRARSYKLYGLGGRQGGYT